MEFKVGDKVKIIGNSRGIMFLQEDVGKTIVLNRLYNDGSWVGLGSNYWWPECDLEEATRFKVGDKVIVNRAGGYKLDLKYSNGDKAIIESIDSDFITLQMDDGGIQMVTPRQIKLDMTSKLLTKTEALKAAIDGQKVQCLHWLKPNSDTYVYFDGKKFMYHWWQEEYDDKANKSLAYDDQWRIYTPTVAKSKFSKGDLFINHKGRIGKVLDNPVLSKGSYKYTVSFNFSDARSKADGYLEEHMVSKFELEED